MGIRWVVPGQGGGGGECVQVRYVQTFMERGVGPWRLARIADEKANAGPSSRDHEEKALKQLLTPLGRVVQVLRGPWTRCIRK